MVVPPALIASLEALRRRLGDAVAVVTGRTVEQVDALLGTAVFAVAGEHGGALRHAPGRRWCGRIWQARLLRGWTRRRGSRRRIRACCWNARRTASCCTIAPCPRPARLLRVALEALLAPAGTAFTLLPARMAWEVRPRGADKGSAVRALMARAPFAGRAPVFVGDDITDEDGIAAAAALGGIGLRVPEAFGDAAGVRRWLAGLAAGKARGAAPDPAGAAGPRPRDERVPRATALGGVQGQSPWRCLSRERLRLRAHPLDQQLVQRVDIGARRGDDRVGVGALAVHQLAVLLQPHGRRAPARRCLR